jgi:hypothetical protein
LNAGKHRLNRGHQRSAIHFARGRRDDYGELEHRSRLRKRYDVVQEHLSINRSAAKRKTCLLIDQQQCALLGLYQGLWAIHGHTYLADRTCNAELH